MLASRTKITFFALCPSSPFQHNFPFIIHEEVMDFMIFVWGGEVVSVDLAHQNYIFALCPSSHFQHNFPFIIHEGVQEVMVFVACGGG